MAISQDDTRIIYSPRGCREEYFAFSDPDMVKKWRKDKSIPLVDVVQSFDIYEVTNGGKEGIAGRPSKQRLENAFGTVNDQEILETILEHGTIHNSRKGSDRPNSNRGVTNETRGKGISTSEDRLGNVHK